MEFISDGECRNALIDLTSLFDESVGGAPVIFCEKTDNGSRIHVAAFAMFGKNNPLFAATKLLTIHRTAEECKNSAAAIARSSTVYGGVCARSEGNYYIHLFSKPEN